MKVTRKDLEKTNEVELTIVLDESSSKKYQAQAVKKLASHVKVDGFRPGKAPAEAVIAKVGEAIFMQQVIDLAIPQAYFEAVQQESIEPYTRPKVEVENMSPLEFKATIALMPEVKLKNIDKLKVKKKAVKVEKDELDGTIYEFQKYAASYKDVDRAAKVGDRAEISFEGFDEAGNTLDGTQSKNHPLIIGDKTFVPGFEENLVGMKVGENKEFTVKFPKDYHREDFKEKNVTFKVSLSRLEEMELAKIDKEFSKKIIGKELEEKEFIEEIKADILRQKESKEFQRQQDELFTKLMEHADMKISSLFIEEEIDALIHQQKHQMEHRGIKWEDFQQMLAETNRNLHEELKEDAEKRVKARFIIREIIKEKDLKVDDKEVLSTLKELGAPKEDQEIGTETFNRIKDQMTLDKIFDTFIEK